MRRATPRERHILAIAGLIADHLTFDLAYGSPWTWADAERANEQGWTVETTAPLGHVVRWEGVRLTPTELRQAWALAERMVEVRHG
mgnify:CR=1 FL=1